MTTRQDNTVFTALLELRTGRLVTAGAWLSEQEAHEWASELVRGGFPVTLRAVVPLFQRPVQLAAAMLEPAQ